MRQIATRAAVDYLKEVRRRRWTSFGADEPAAAVTASDPSLSLVVMQAFERLPVKLQVVGVLALVEEQPHAEIAEALGIPLGTVKSRLFRATRLLRDELSRLGVHT